MTETDKQNLLKKGYQNLLMSSCEPFTKRMFLQMQKKPYIVGRHHQLIFSELDKVVKGETTKLIINIAPRYGKTLLASQMFLAYGLALNPLAKFLHLSYSSSLAEENSIAVKDIVNDEFFKACFPVRIKFGSDTKAKWSTEQGGGVYATSTLGQVTGFGAGQVENEDGSIVDEYFNEFNPNGFSGAIVIDDPIKPEDALSDTMREAVNRRFETTIRNRVNSRKTPIIIIMQRLHENDLCGYLQSVEPNEWRVLSIPCVYEEDGERKALWEFKHNLSELDHLAQTNPFVFETQYMQNPTPLQGLMYTELRTYDVMPTERGVRKNYTDTADTGADFLCSICYVETPTAMYITDIVYTNKPMETTEPMTAKMLTKNQTDFATIESNNGGRGFARNVERNMRDLGNRRTRVSTFCQRNNKEVRIFTHSNEVQNLIYFPSDWKRRWSDFYNAVKSYRKEGRNHHDDAVDALTGMCEFFGKGVGSATATMITR